MKTNIVIYFNSEGTSPSRVAELIEELGFRGSFGRYDFVYQWDHEPSEKEILTLGDKVKEKLNGSKVYFKIESNFEL